MFILTWQTLQPLFTDQQGIPWQKPKNSDDKCLLNVYFDLANLPTAVFRSARSTWGEAAMKAESL